MINFTRYDFALIGVRLLAIYLFLQILSSLPGWVMALSMLFRHSVDSSFSHSFVFQFMGIVLPLLIVCVPILMWVFSAAIAGIIIKAPETNASDNKIQSADLVHIQSILFCAIGVFIFATTMPECIAWLYSFFRDYILSIQYAHSTWASVPVFILIVLKIIMSLVLIFSAKNLSIFISKLRYAGSRK